MPTWQGWILLLLLAMGLGCFSILETYPFLAVQAPLRSDVLVVEGWVDDHVFEEAARQFKQEGYQVLASTGIPLDQGSFLSEYKTYADLGYANLRKLGLPEKSLASVPAPRVRTDRTYASAVALATWLRQHYPHAKAINVITGSVHARRTRLLYEKALGKDIAVGIQGIKDLYFDGHDWWRSSQGFRMVTDEVVAYIYARFIFRPTVLPPG